MATRVPVLMVVAICMLSSHTLLAAGVDSDDSRVEVQEWFIATEGAMDMKLDIAALRSTGLSIAKTWMNDRDDGVVSLSFDVDSNRTMYQILTADGALGGLPGGEIYLRAIKSPFDSLYVVHDVMGGQDYEFVVYDTSNPGTPVFGLSAAQYDFRHAERDFTIRADLVIAREYAQRSGRGDSGDTLVGHVVITLPLHLSQSIVFDRAGRAESATLHTIADGPTAAGFPNPGPDVIVGELPNTQQFGRSGPAGSGTVGLSVGTTSCNKGSVPLNWNALPNRDHPMIPMNLYRLRTAADGTDRMEQIGQSWMKHAFTALQMNACSFGCSSSSPQLGVGCSDPYGVGLNASQCGLGPRAALNPYTGAIPVSGNLGSSSCGASYLARDHRDHTHDGISHRIQVLDVDLMPSLNPGARYFSEGQYVTPHEFDNPDGLANQNMNNNVSHREVGVTEGTPGNFTFPNIGPTVREEPSLNEWTGATQVVIEPQTFIDGHAVLAYEVTQTAPSTWHYEYGIYNMNLDRSIDSFAVPIPPGVIVSNVEFHAPLNHAPEAHTDNYSNTPWPGTTVTGAIKWATDTFAVDPNANAIRFGTLYNFRFDANSAPGAVNGEVTTFKIPATLQVAIMGPSPVGPQDCNNNTIEDTCDIDCGAPGCAVAGCGGSSDCNANGVPDACEIPAPVGTCVSFCAEDCNTNGTPDDCELVGNDCNSNGIPDECEPDCNANGVADTCDIANATSSDCNANDTPDECEVPSPGGICTSGCLPDCNANGVPDECDTSLPDCNLNGIPDECEAGLVCECGNGILEAGEACDDGNIIPGDGCDQNCQRESIDQCADAAPICNETITGDTLTATSDGVLGCSQTNNVWYSYTPSASGTTTVSLCGSDFDTVHGVHTGCPATSGNQVACDDDGCGGVGVASVLTFSAVANTTYYISVGGWNGSTGNYALTVSGPDCGCTSAAQCNDGNPCTTDSCDGLGVCVNTNNTDPCDDGDVCTEGDTCSGGSCVPGGPLSCDGFGCNDCNGNMIADECEAGPDCNANTIPDECETDCQPNGVPDDCDISSGTSPDTDGNGVPDECEAGPGCTDDWECYVDAGGTGLPGLDVCSYYYCDNGTCASCTRNHGQTCARFDTSVAVSDILCAVQGFTDYTVCPSADIIGSADGTPGPSGIPIAISDILGIVSAFSGDNPFACPNTMGDPNGCDLVNPPIPPTVGCAAAATATPSAAPDLSLLNDRAVRTSVGDVDSSPQFILAPRQRTARSGGYVDVDVFVSDVDGLIGYQFGAFAEAVSAGGRNSDLVLESVDVDAQRSDYVFHELYNFPLTDQKLGRLGGVVMGSGVSVGADEQAYLGTFRMRIAAGAGGEYRIAAAMDFVELWSNGSRRVAVGPVPDARIAVTKAGSARQTRSGLKSAADMGR
jgi:hypothetical protein